MILIEANSRFSQCVDPHLLTMLEDTLERARRLPDRQDFAHTASQLCECVRTITSHVGYTEQAQVEKALELFEEAERLILEKADGRQPLLDYAGYISSHYIPFAAQLRFLLRQDPSHSFPPAPVSPY